MAGEGLAARAQSFVFGLPILLSLVFVLGLLPDTVRKWEMWHSGVTTTGTLRHAGSNTVYLDYEVADDRRYTNRGLPEGWQPVALALPGWPHRYAELSAR